jgi:protein gp37
MSANSKIEWTDHTFNPWIGCTKVSPGCANCYAEAQNNLRKWNREGWGKGVPRKRTSEANWKHPLMWNKQASVESQCASSILQDSKAGERNIEWATNYHRPRVFCASLADWLDDEIPIQWLADLLDLIRRTPNLDWLLLSKRPENWLSRVEQAGFHLRRIRPDDAGGTAHDRAEGFVNAWLNGVEPSNVWIGTTVENQDMADKRLPQLLSIPARVRFLSCEPLLDPVDISSILPDEDGYRATGDHYIDWVICGGESGPNASPMNPDWARSLRDQCAAASVPFFMKQMGGTRKPFAPIPDDLNIRQFPTP